MREIRPLTYKALADFVDDIYAKVSGLWEVGLRKGHILYATTAFQLNNDLTNARSLLSLTPISVDDGTLVTRPTYISPYPDRSKY